MTTMLEQSARALAVAWYCRADDDEEVKAQAAEQWPGFVVLGRAVVLARAALQAMGEPSPQMIEAATGSKNPVLNTERWDDQSVDVSEIWTDMLTAILEEKPE